MVEPLDDRNLIAVILIGLGVMVAAVLPDSPAMEAGILPGDLITEYNGQTVQDSLDLAAKKPEDKKLAESGKIAIQDHGQPFWVRNIKVKSL